MMSGLPSNNVLREFAREVDWQSVDEAHEQFQEYINGVRSKRGSHVGSTAMIKHISQWYYETEDGSNPEGNVLLSRNLSRPVVLGNLLGRRFQQGSWLDYIKPYNLNPAVIHENVHEAGGMLKVRPVGAELEVGMVRRDGAEPTEQDLDAFHQAYVEHALRLGGNIDLSPELCIYQAELILPPAYGFAKIMHHLELNMAALVHATQTANLLLSPLSVYPFESDFATSQIDKVEQVAIFLHDVNEARPHQIKLRDEFCKRFQVSRAPHRTANLLRFQGFHMHVDLAGRSEALGLLSYAMSLNSASAIANAAMLKGGPFMDGVCDPEMLCAREYTRSISVTGHYIGLPLSPHLQPDGLEKNASLLRDNLANGAARALLYGEEDGLPYSGMHNMLGRVRPDLGSTSRVCTLESTGMPSNPSVERLAAIACDFQYSQLAIEHYFRQHGTDLDPLLSDPEFMDIFGPLDRTTFHTMVSLSDCECTDMLVKTARGIAFSLVEFYEKKRRLLKRIFSPLNVIDTRDIDGLYDRIYHFLVAPNGGADTIDDYINHPTRRGTGNWGKILRNSFQQLGGTLGAKQPDVVNKTAEQVHRALVNRYEQM